MRGGDEQSGSLFSYVWKRELARITRFERSAAS